MKYRVLRISELLVNLTASGAQSNITMDKMAAIQMDVLSKLFQDYRPLIERLDGMVNSDIEEWRVRLAYWDGLMDDN